MHFLYDIVGIIEEHVLIAERNHIEQVLNASRNCSQAGQNNFHL